MRVRTVNSWPRPDLRDRPARTERCPARRKNRTGKKGLRRRRGPRAKKLRTASTATKAAPPGKRGRTACDRKTDGRKPGARRMKARPGRKVRPKENRRRARKAGLGQQRRKERRSAFPGTQSGA